MGNEEEALNSAAIDFLNCAVSLVELGQQRNTGTTKLSAPNEQCSERKNGVLLGKIISLIGKMCE